jgi:outer membrane protein OmpA-like peptidoglycan-associated protein
MFLGVHVRAHLRDGFGEIELVDPLAAPVGMRRVTGLELGALARSLRRLAGDPLDGGEVRRVARDHAGFQAGIGYEPDPRRALDRLLHAIESERLFVRRVDAPRPLVPGETPIVDLADLGSPDEPASTATDTAPTWFEVRIVDEIGVPIAGVPMRFSHEGQPVSATTDGDGRARIDVDGVSFASVAVGDTTALHEELEARWRTIRPGEILEPSGDLDVCFVREGDPPKASLLAKAPHTISLQPDVRLVRLLGLHFDTWKSFLLPTALPNVRALAELYAENPGAALLVVGHAEPGEAEHADDVALERAESVAAFLQDDVDTWLSRYEDGVPTERRWGGAEDKLMLKSLPDYPEKPLEENAVRWFQRTRGLQVDSIAGPETRRHLVAEYMAHDGTSLPADVAIEVHGAGAGFPLPEPAPEDQAAHDRHSTQEHRRAELFFFARPFGVLPPAPGPTSDPGAPEMGEWLRRSRRIVDLSAEGSTKDVTLLEMADVLFRTESCVVLPEGEDPSATADHPSLSTAGLVATVLRYAEMHPDKSLLVAGHCDTTGTPDYNQPLSEERAEAALALLVGDREAWKSLCHARHTVADYKQILSWVARAFDPATLAVPFDCDPGTIDDQAYTGIEPVRRFQAAYNANMAAIGAPGPELAEDGAMGPLTWGALFDCYEHALRLELDLDAAGVQRLRDGLRWVDDERRALGFSEHHPIDELGRDDFRSQANRRVEVLFFDPGEEPDLDQAGGAPEMSEIYLPGRYQRHHLDPRLSTNPVAVRLCTPTGEPIPGAPYTVTMGRDVAEDVADADGYLTVHVPVTQASFVVDWSDPNAADPAHASYTREVVLDLGSGDDADRRRLTNLGYLADSLAAQLAEFRAEFGRPASVSDDDLRVEIRDWHDGGARPASSAEADGA